MFTKNCILKSSSFKMFDKCTINKIDNDTFVINLMGRSIEELCSISQIAYVYDIIDYKKVKFEFHISHCFFVHEPQTNNAWMKVYVYYYENEFFENAYNEFKKSIKNDIIEMEYLLKENATEYIHSYKLSLYI